MPASSPLISFMSCSVKTEEAACVAFSGFVVCISGFTPALFSTVDVALIPSDVAAGVGELFSAVFKVCVSLSSLLPCFSLSVRA